MISREQLIEILEQELAAIEDVQARQQIATVLVDPALMQCGWDYGPPGQAFPCWKVGHDPEGRSVGIVYCESGFGPRSPWGLVWLHEAIPSMGQDSGWFQTFREAAGDVLNIPPSSLNLR
jgi:hypothetical protein